MTIITRFLTLGALVAFAPLSSALDLLESRDYGVHLKHSTARVLTRLGVTEESYRLFFESMREAADAKASDREDCVLSLSDDQAGRSQFLNCLAEGGRKNLNQDLFYRISQAKWSRVQTSPTSDEIQKSILLLAYLEDLVRESLESQKVSTSWWIEGRGFQPQKFNQADFDYEDGDVVLMIANSSISSLISQATSPQRRFSHAMMVRKEGVRFASIEALIEKGVTTGTLESFGKDTLQSVVVLRWRDKTERAAVAQRASNCAKKFLDAKTPYNFAMDLGDTSKMFCSQLVAHCYAEASGLDLKSMIPQVGMIRSEAVFDYLQNLGIKTKSMPSPGDLATSKNFEVVAQFRRVRDAEGKPALSRLWDMYTLGDVYVERLERGQKMHLEQFAQSHVIPVLEKLNLSVPDIRDLLGPDSSLLSGLLPEGVDARSAVVMKAQEILIFEQVWKRAPETLRSRNVETKSLFVADPITRRSALSLDMNRRDEVSTALFH